MTSLTNLFRGFLLVSLMYHSVSAQITNTDCIGATAICNNIYVESIVPADNGLFPSEINPQISCGGGGEVLNIWYTFTVNKTGKFGFLIQPNDPFADYDWTLFNLTRASCNDIFFDPNLLVSCNAAGDVGCQGDTGATGANSFNVQGGNCGALFPNLDDGRTPFNDLIDVFKGNTYVLTVSNWSQESGGYTIDFSPSGDIGIIDNLDPVIANIDAASDCIVSEIDIQFSENIQCNTINLENISIDGMTGNVVSIRSDICDQGGFSDNKFNVQLDDPISISGSYDVTITPTSRNPVTDLCDNSTGTVTDFFTVVNDGPQPSIVDAIPDDPCQINSIIINFSEPILCTGTTRNSFSVTGPSGTIAGSTRIDNCTSSSSFVYEFDQPIIENEVYQVTVNQVPGFTITNECLKSLAANSTVDFSKDAQAGANIESVGWNDACAISELRISFSDAIICNTIENGNINISYQGDVLNGTIVDSNCDNGNPMTLTEITFELDEEIDVNGQYDVQLITNGIDEVLTLCGTPSLSGSKDFNVNLMLETPQITAISFPDSCNIQTMTLSFSKEVNCQTAQNADINLRYEDQDIAVSPIANSCNMSQMIELQLSSPINSNGDYIFDFVSTADAFTDVCGIASESTNIMGSLTFNDCDSCFVYVPNAFSPNGDTVNDDIGPLSNCEFESISMVVFDRWGNLVFESKGETLNWDGLFQGENIQRGIYAYIIEIELSEFRRSATRTRKGTFSIM